MEESSKNEILNIENKVYIYNGIQVMFDLDLAELFGVETKRINEAVKRNQKKFKNNYYIRINESEFNSLKSQVATSKGGSRKGHGLFTEQGIIMLATILKTNYKMKILLNCLKRKQLLSYLLIFN